MAYAALPSPRGGTSRNFLKAISGLDRDFVYIGGNISSRLTTDCHQ